MRLPESTLAVLIDNCGDSALAVHLPDGGIVTLQPGSARRFAAWLALDDGWYCDA